MTDAATPAPSDEPTGATAPIDGDTSTPGVRTLPAAQAAAHLDAPDVLVLDVRSAPEVAQLRIPGAVQIDYYAVDFPRRIDLLDRSRPVLLYCRSGQRSGDTARLMRSLEFHDVVDVDGGLIAWNEAGLPVES